MFFLRPGFGFDINVILVAKWFWGRIQGDGREKTKAHGIRVFCVRANVRVSDGVLFVKNGGATVVRARESRKSESRWAQATISAQLISERRQQVTVDRSELEKRAGDDCIWAPANWPE